MELALDHYLNVVYGKNLRGEEKLNLFRVQQAGLPAIKLARDLQKWEQLAKLCKRLIDLLPPLRATLEKEFAKASERIRPEND